MDTPLNNRSFQSNGDEVNAMMSSDHARHFLIWTIVVVLLGTGGCHNPKRMRHVTALSYFPFRTAMEPPPEVPYCASPLYYGYEKTCWRTWPEDWNQFPACGVEWEGDVAKQFGFPSENGAPDADYFQVEPDPPAVDPDQMPVEPHDVGPPEPDAVDPPDAAAVSPPLAETPQLVATPWRTEPQSAGQAMAAPEHPLMLGERPLALVETWPPQQTWTPEQTLLLNESQEPTGPGTSHVAVNPHSLPLVDPERVETPQAPQGTPMPPAEQQTQVPEQTRPAESSVPYVATLPPTLPVVDPRQMEQTRVPEQAQPPESSGPYVPALPVVDPQRMEQTRVPNETPLETRMPEVPGQTPQPVEPGGAHVVEVPPAPPLVAPEQVGPPLVDPTQAEKPQTQVETWAPQETWLPEPREAAEETRQTVESQVPHGTTIQRTPPLVATPHVEPPRAPQETWPPGRIQRPQQTRVPDETWQPVESLAPRSATVRPTPTQVDPVRRPPTREEGRGASVHPIVLTPARPPRPGLTKPADKPKEPAVVDKPVTPGRKPVVKSAPLFHMGRGTRARSNQHVNPAYRANRGIDPVFSRRAEVAKRHRMADANWRSAAPARRTNRDEFAGFTKAVLERLPETKAPATEGSPAER